MTSDFVISPGFGYSYNLNLNELAELEAKLVDLLRNVDSVAEGLAVVIATTESPFSNFARTLECEAFPGVDFATEMVALEPNSMFILTVDLNAAAVVHCKRVVTCYSLDLRQQNGLTGIEVFDDRLSATDPEECIDLDSILNYHDINSLENVLNVTTNFATNRAGRQSTDRPYTLVSYKALYEMIRLIDGECVVAYLNAVARSSLEGLGVECELLAGSLYHLPIVNSGTYDLNYEAVVIPVSKHNVELFDALAAWKVPLLWLEADETVRESVN